MIVIERIAEQAIGLYLNVEVINKLGRNLLTEVCKFCVLSDSCKEMVFFSWTLMQFEAISTWRINLEKSVVFPMGEVGDVEALAG